MKPVVLDASAALAWLLKGQKTAASDAMLLRVSEFAFVAPFVFDWEVQNVLLSAGRLDAAFYRAALWQLDGLGVGLEAPLAVPAVLDLARESGLSLFDAAYLELALDRAWPLMSRDSRLVETALASGVEVHDLR